MFTARMSIYQDVTGVARQQLCLCQHHTELLGTLGYAFKTGESLDLCMILEHAFRQANPENTALHAIFSDGD